jgi:hypothetical protein
VADGDHGASAGGIRDDPLDDFDAAQVTRSLAHRDEDRVPIAGPIWASSFADAPRS